MRKGRHRFKHILKPEQVADIRSRLGPHGMGRILAKEYGVSTAAISNINTGKTW